MSFAVATMFFTRSSEQMSNTLAGQAFRSIATLFFTSLSNCCSPSGSGVLRGVISDERL